MTSLSPVIIGYFLLILSAAQLFRAVFRLKANTHRGGFCDVMGRDMTYSYDYLLFMLATLAGVWWFTSKWPALLGLAVGLQCGEIYLQLASYHAF